MEQIHSSSRVDRKIVEKNRRLHMKTLYAKLNSLIPNPNPKNRKKTQTEAVDLLRRRNKMEQIHSSSRVDRKIVEKNRRLHMKTLYAELNSLIPNPNPKEVTLLPDQLDNAVNYIKLLEVNIEKLKEKRDCLMGINEINQSMNEGMVMDLQSPHIEVRVHGSAMMVILISGLDYQIMLYQSIRVLEEEGAEVVNASFSVVGNQVFHTIHSMVPNSSIGFEASKISQRLTKLAQQCMNAS